MSENFMSTASTIANLAIDPMAAKLNTTVAYTDGACKGNPGAGGWGAHLIFSDGRTQDLYGGETPTTNNRMELMGAIQALKYSPDDLKLEIWTDSTISYDHDYQDGLSLFYFARMRTGQPKKVNAPVFINEKYEKTYINFYNEVEDMDIDAVDYDIACVRLDGDTEFRGIFGLTGYFEGWFSNDEYAVPIVAKMQVLIGSITLELKEWKKQGWMPPKYQD